MAEQRRDRSAQRARAQRRAAQRTARCSAWLGLRQASARLEQASCPTARPATAPVCKHRDPRSWLLLPRCIGAVQGHHGSSPLATRCARPTRAALQAPWLTRETPCQLHRVNHAPRARCLEARPRSLGKAGPSEQHARLRDRSGACPSRLGTAGTLRAARAACSRTAGTTPCHVVRGTAARRAHARKRRRGHTLPAGETRVPRCPRSWSWARAPRRSGPSRSRPRRRAPGRAGWGLLDASPGARRADRRGEREGRGAFQASIPLLHNAFAPGLESTAPRTLPQ